MTSIVTPPTQRVAVPMPAPPPWIAVGVTPALAVGATVPSKGATDNAGNVIPKPRPVFVVGIPVGTKNATSTQNRFARDTDFDNLGLGGDDRVDRGYIRTHAEVSAEGATLYVTSRHADANDRISLSLLAEVFDRDSNALRTIKLAQLTQSEDLNGDKFRAVTAFTLSYDAINAYLQARNPSLSLTPGATTLAVAALWDTGHQAGGYGRGGEFRLPWSAMKVVGGADAALSTNATSTNATSTNATSTNASGADAALLPLDMQVAYPLALIEDVPGLKLGGNIVSRLESEFKGVISDSQRHAAIGKMYRMAEAGSAAGASAKGAVSSLLGADWVMEPVRRHWTVDDGSEATSGSKPGGGFFKGYRVDADGYPLQDTMSDIYVDSGPLAVTQHQGAIRLRTNKAATLVNVKPGAGVRDPKTGVTQRIEVGLELHTGTSVDQAANILRNLARDQWSGTVFNHAQKQLHRLDSNIRLSRSLNPWLDVRQQRHKFVVKNVRTKVEIEFSFDHVETETLRESMRRNGVPRCAEFYVVEAELDHLQLASANQSTFEAGNNPSTEYFVTNEDQDAWLREAGDDVTMDIDPRLHELEDLQNKAFRQTDSYATFEKVTGKVISTLFPAGVGDGIQKAAHAARALDVLAFDGRELQAAVGRMVARAGYMWTPELAALLEASVNTSEGKRTAERALRSQPDDMLIWLQTMDGSADVVMDPVTLNVRLTRILNSLGYESTAEITHIVDLAVRQLTPATIENQFSNLSVSGASDAIANLARKSGAPSETKLEENVSYLLGAGTRLGGSLRRGLKQSDLNPAAALDLEELFRQLHARGASVAKIVSSVERGSWNIVEHVEDLAREWNAQAMMPLVTASESKLRRNLADQFSGHIKLSEDIDRLIHALATKVDGRRALAYVRSSSVSPQSLRETALRLGLQSIRIEYDFDIIDSRAASAFGDQGVIYDEPMRAFIHKAITLGAAPYGLYQAINVLADEGTLKKALHYAKVTLPGVELPVPTYDWMKIEKGIRKADWSGAKFLGTSSEIREFVAAAIPLGVGFSSMHVYLQAVWSYGRRRASASHAEISVTTLPTLPVDQHLLVAHWANKFAADWSPETQTRIESALPHALGSAFFRLATAMQSSDSAALVKLLEGFTVSR